MGVLPVGAERNTDMVIAEMEQQFADVEVVQFSGKIACSYEPRLVTHVRRQRLFALQNPLRLTHEEEIARELDVNLGYN